MKKENFYVEPKCEEVLALGIELTCTSPADGRTEGVQEEEWLFP